MHTHSHTGHAGEQFPTDTTDLELATAPETVEIADGDEYDLDIAPVAKRLGDATVRMLAYNGSIPGPTLRVEQGATVTINVVNRGDLEATVHWHGLRLDNRYDGTHETQPPIPVGGSFTARVEFPDPGPTGTTRTSARTTGKRWGSTATSSWRPRRRPTGRR